MDPQTLDLLESRNKNDRKRGVSQLAQSGDQAALKYLAAVYKTDTDPEIRELALKAGRYLKKQLEGGETPAAARPAGRTAAPAVPVEEKPKAERVKVSGADESRSKALLDQAMDLFVAEDLAKAREFARKAFKLNPNLQFDPFYLGMGANIFDVPTGDVMETVMSGGAGAGDGRKSKRKRGEADEDGGDVGWDTALVDLLFYGLVYVAVAIVSALLYLIVLRDTLQNIFNSLAATDPTFSASEFEQFFGLALGASTPVVLIGTVISALFAIIGLLIFYFFIHIAARFILGGEGTFPGLIHGANNFMIGLLVIGGVLSVLLTVYYLNAFNTVFVGLEASTFDPETTDLEAFGAIMNTLSLIGIGSLVFLLVVTGWLSSILGRVYRFGFARGCVSLILGYVLLVVAMGCFSFILMQSLLSSLMTMMPSM